MSPTFRLIRSTRLSRRKGWTVSVRILGVPMLREGIPVGVLALTPL